MTGTVPVVTGRRGRRLARPAGRRQRIDAQPAAEPAAEPTADSAVPQRPPPRTRRRRRQISARRLLLLTSLALVGSVLLLALSAGLLRRTLTHRLDQQIRAAGDRYAALVEDPADNDHDADDSFDRMVGPTDGTVGVQIAGGKIVSAALIRNGKQLTGPDQAKLASLRQSSSIQQLKLPALGSYRVSVRQVSARAANAQVVNIVGLPTASVDRSVVSLLASEAIVLAVLAVLTVGFLLTAVRIGPPEAGIPALPPDEGVVQQRLRDLMAEASHELRTPAAVIHSYAEFAERASSDLPPSVDHALRRIGSESSRMGHMVEDLLSLSRFEAGLRPAMTEVDLTRIVIDTIEDARMAASDHDWQLSVPAEPLWIAANEHWLRQALANLAANARAHTPPGTTVRLTLRCSSASAEVSVLDDGPGIAADLLPTIFDRFARSADAERYDGLTGVGLGLSLVRQIALAHGGSIEVASQPGRTEFVLRLPGRPSKP